jgi:hypothetical protein
MWVNVKLTTNSPKIWGCWRGIGGEFAGERRSLCNGHFLSSPAGIHLRKPVLALITR